jgi:CelD/BcsL family acetyltransferase involved in cellulose biosynthesis
VEDVPAMAVSRPMVESAQTARVTVHTTGDAFDRLKGEWNAIFDASRAELFFVSHSWQRLCWKHLGRGNLQIVAVRANTGTLCGLIPFWLEDAPDGPTMRLGGAEDVSDYLDMIVLPGLEQLVADRLLDFLLFDPAAPRWSKVELEYVPDSSPTLAALGEAAKIRGLDRTKELHDICPVVPLPPTFSEYLSSLTASRRRSLLRKRRSALACGTRWYKVVQGEPGIDAEIRSFFDLMSQSPACKRDLLATAGIRAFLRDLLLDDSTEPRAELVFLVTDNEKAAAVLQFVAGDRIMFYNSARRCQAAGSPGIVLLSFCIEDAIHRGFHHYDFLRGEEDYKYRLGGRDRATYRMSISRRTPVHP